MDSARGVVVARARGGIVQPRFHRPEIVKPITIVGGGLAGLALGVALRRNDVPVSVIEAGHYPRHRVCGEFISGEGLRVLDGLAVLDNSRPFERRPED